MVLHGAKRFAKALEVDYLTLTQKFDYVYDVRVIDKP
jgi:hypothetical protein